MRILVLGAGGIGGYFGGRLAEAGADITFLVREPRAKRLHEKGLIIRSPAGNAQLAIKTVTVHAATSVVTHEVTHEVIKPFDVILLSCKAYDLDSAIQSLQSITPAVGQHTVILPLLNGLAHFDRLDAAFGAERVLGGLCHISVTASADGEIHHLSPLQLLTFGRRSGAPDSDRCHTIADLFMTANFTTKLSINIVQDLWEKFAFLATAAAMTCLMRANVGAIMKTDHGAAITRRLLAECEEVARASGFAIRAKAASAALATLTEPGSDFTASMLRDIEGARPIEAGQIVGDMIRRGQSLGLDTKILEIAYCHLQAYQAMRIR